MLIRLMWLFDGPSRCLHHTYLLVVVFFLSLFPSLVRSCRCTWMCVCRFCFPFSLAKVFNSFDSSLSFSLSFYVLYTYFPLVFLVLCVFNSCSNKMRSVCCFFQLVFIVVDGDIVFFLCFIFVDFLLWSSIFSIYLCLLFLYGIFAFFFPKPTTFHPYNKYIVFSTLYVLWIWMWLQSFWK